MKISVVIPTYKRSKLLGECLDSFVKQSLSPTDYEIIVCDNNSKDDTFEFVQHYIKNHPEANISYQLEKRPGLVYSRHCGAKAAKSNIVVFTDDDGEYNYDCLKSLLKCFDEFPKAVAVGGRIDILWDKEPPKWIIPYQFTQGELNYGNESVCSNKLFINGGLFCIKKDVLFQLGGFNPEQVGETYIGDGETGLCRKIHAAGYEIAWTPKAIMQHKQFVEKNAKMKDLGRRYYNNGICDSYDLMSRYDFNLNFMLFKHAIKLYLFYIKSWLKFKLKNAGEIKEDSLEEYLKLEFKKGQYYFFINYLNSNYRKKYKQKDWF